MDGKVITDIERNNRTAMCCHIIEAIVITITFFAEAFMGDRTIGYVAIVAVFALGPVVLELYYWNRDRQSAAIKHCAAIGFAITYTFILFTTTNHMVFVYVIPMVLMIQVFHDTAYAIKINIGTVLENLIVVIGGSMTGKFGFQDMGAGLLQIYVMVLVGIYSYLTAKTIGENNEQKLLHVQDAQKQTEDVLEGIADTNEKMQAGIGEIHDKVEKLKGASSTTKEAMEDVTSGATETADAVQKQLEQTEAIQQLVSGVDAAANAILERMGKTLAILEDGNKSMDKLVSEVEISVQNGVDVAEKLETLDQYITEMNSIVELISGITEQTSLLSLNATIEAARAGDAGKGFAVVATEISSMATQTQEATVHITELINNISGAISQVVTVVRGMIDGINAQKEATVKTEKSFGTIESHTFAIRDHVEGLAESIKELKISNEGIVESIQTISAISEEVSAHANETLNAEESNMLYLTTIAEMSDSLLDLTRMQE